MSNMKSRALIYVAKHHKHIKYIGFIVAAIAIAAIWLTPKYASFSAAWSRLVSPAVGAVTLVVSLAVWLGTETRAWVDRLPKRLNVIFKAPFVGASGCPDQDKVISIMACQMAHLGGEGDIRALAQQIGAQMAAPKDAQEQVHLKFTASPADFQLDESPKYERDGTGKLCKVYSVSIKLLHAPPLIQAAMRKVGAAAAYCPLEWHYGCKGECKDGERFWDENYAQLSQEVIDAKKSMAGKS